MKSLLLIILALTTTFAKLSLDEESINSNITAIPGDSTYSVYDSTKKDSLDIAPDSSQLDTIDAIEKGLILGVKWGFANSSVFKSWGSRQRGVKDSLEKDLKDSSYHFKGSWQQEPQNQSITFPLTVGYFKMIDSSRSFTLRGSYIFRRDKAVFSATQDSTDETLYSYENGLYNHQFELFGTIDFRFNKSYFSIQGVRNSGVSLGLGIIPLDIFKAKFESTTNAIDNKSVVSSGIGGSWHVAFFSEKQSSNSLATRLFVNYHGSVHYGFSNYNELIFSDHSSSSNSTTFVENFYELGAIFIIKGKRGKDE